MIIEGEEIGKIFCNDKEAGKEVVNKILNSIHFSKNEIPEQVAMKIHDEIENRLRGLKYIKKT